MEQTRHRVIGLRELGEGTYVLRMERRNLVFEPGQYLHVGPLPGIDRREYSIYSSPADDYLEILVKEIREGLVSPRLRRLVPGDHVDIEGPFGFFRIEGEIADANYLFVATGTGISPFHSMVRFRPDMNYLLVHGIRGPAEKYDHGDFDSRRVVSCMSRSAVGGFPGRVTDWLRGNPVSPDAMAYLCGNCDMIYEVYDILGTRGFPADRIHAEVYF